MVVMPLESDDDRKALSKLADHDPRDLIITGAIEIVDNYGNSTFFSRPGGKTINFIKFSGYPGRWQVIRPKTHSVIIYSEGYFPEDFFSRSFFWVKHLTCACKLPGECCLYNRFANFDDIEKVALVKPNQLSFGSPLMYWKILALVLL